MKQFCCSKGFRASFQFHWKTENAQAVNGSTFYQRNSPSETLGLWKIQSDGVLVLERHVGVFNALSSKVGSCKGFRDRFQRGK